jgi:hypothetical protein
MNAEVLVDTNVFHSPHSDDNNLDQTLIGL